ncbi:SGNH/GDSL hydrolase family protein [Candidatus Omnitrophota bacterium]
MNISKYFKNIIFTIIIVICVFGGLEGLARIKCSTIRRKSRNLFEYDENKIFRHKKNFKTVFTGVEVVTNSFGHRDEEIPIKKEAGEYRILALGDSVTFGHGVLAKETYPEIIEDLFKMKKGIKVNVINTACCGNSTVQEYYDFKESLCFKPDRVILQFTLNDVTEPYFAYKKYGGFGDDYNRVCGLRNYDHFLRQYSAFYVLLKKTGRIIKHKLFSIGLLKKKVIDRKIYTTTNGLTKQDDPRIAASWETCFDLMKKIQAICVENNFPLTIIAIPIRFQATDSLGVDLDTPLGTFCRDNNIDYIDYKPIFLEEFKKGGAWEDYFSDTCHFSKKGHQFVANHLYEKFAKDL